MPKMLQVEVNPDFLKKLGAKATPADRKAFEEAKGQGRMTQAYVTAMENARSGLYRIVPEEPSTPVPTSTRLEDMPTEDLKVLMLQTGVKTQKQMKRSEIISVIRRKLAEVEIVEDDAGEQTS